MTFDAIRITRNRIAERGILGRGLVHDASGAARYRGAAADGVLAVGVVHAR